MGRFGRRSDLDESGAVLRRQLNSLGSPSTFGYRVTDHTLAQHRLTNFITYSDYITELL